MDTIFALSSGALPAGVAVVRVSGSACETVLRQTVGRLPAPRRATLCSIRARNNELVDEGIVVWFPGPASFTGEDSAEFHVHGGRAVVERLLEVLGGFDGCRMAEAGEFSRRAFVNGKFDLTAAEGLADLIAAETEGQRALALAQSSGALATLYDNWQERLLHGRAMIEAEIDFADEDDVPGSVSGEVWADMLGLRGEISTHLEGTKRGTAVREGFRIAIVGAPNAGKSSLVNALAGSDVAIVSEEPGTTRDAIEVRLVLAGHLVVITDTAGIRTGAGTIESEGIRRSFARAAEADLVIYLSERGEWAWINQLKNDVVWKVVSKADLENDGFDSEAIHISTISFGGLETLLSRLTGHVSKTLGRDAATLPTRQRHADNLRQCLADLDHAIDGNILELRAESLRQAAYGLGRITGQHGVEDVLGVIFSQFCIGK